MRRRRQWLGALAVAGSVILTACDGSGDTSLGELGGTESAASTSSGTSSSEGSQTSEQSVGDVTTDINGGAVEPAQPLPPKAAVAARVRNESANRADVTLRFIHDETVVHLAFVRVLPDTVTTVLSPKPAGLIEASGIDERGEALASDAFAFGVDFDETTPAEYTITDEPPDEPPPDDPEPDNPEPATLTMLEPASDDTRTLGSTLFVRWADTGGAPGAVVRVFLRPAGEGAATGLFRVGPAVGAALDGINDKLSIVLEGLEPGLYDVVGEIDDGTMVATSVAPGRVELLVDPGNDAPSLTILAPTVLKELRDGDSLRVAWDDEDEDDNATITFSLEPTEPVGVGVAPFVISPPIAEDPDEDGADAATLLIDEVLTGLYDLVGTIEDGELAGTARVEGVVQVLPEPENDVPVLVLIEPAGDVEIDLSGSFRVRWTDSDENDNARISLLLDPDLDSGVLDGNEIVLVGSLGEDDDGLSDEITLGVPTGVAIGTYRVVGAITDGLAEVVTWAPGIVYFGVPASGEVTPPSPALALLEPSDAVRTRLGESINVFLEATDIPPEAQVRLFLSNTAYGGAVRAEVTPVNLLQNRATALTLLPSAAIPNDAWPRQFNLEATVEVDGVDPTVALGCVWVRQEVEILSVEMMNYSCEPGVEPEPGDREFVGLEITWYGGGFEEREPHAEVKFWVTNDGAVPYNGEPDSKHRIIQTALESPSPNVNRVSQVSIWRAVGFPYGLGDEVGSALDPGAYQLMTTVEPEGFGRITSPPHPDWVELCYRLRGPGDGGLP